MVRWCLGVAEAVSEPQGGATFFGRLELETRGSRLKPKAVEPAILRASAHVKTGKALPRAALVALALASVAIAQTGRVAGGTAPARSPAVRAPATSTAASPSARHVHERLARSGRPGLVTDYPTRIHTLDPPVADHHHARGPGRARRTPARRRPLTDPSLFRCGFTMIEDAGTADFTDEEVTGCARTCSRAASSGWTISGATGPWEAWTGRSPGAATRAVSDRRRAHRPPDLPRPVPRRAPAADSVDPVLERERRRHFRARRGKRRAGARGQSWTRTGASWSS